MDPEWSKYLTDPPCKCGNDLGLPTSPSPSYVEGTAGMAQPATLTMAAVRVPADADMHVVMSTQTGSAGGYFKLTPGGYHIMVTAGGQQYTCSAALVASPEHTDGTIYNLSAEPLADVNEEGAYDPRVVLLRHLWAQQGYPDVEVWGLERTQNVSVRGQISLARLNTRWFTDNGIFRHMGGAYVVEEPDGVLRFLRPEQMALEFQRLVDPNGTELRNLQPKY